MAASRNARRTNQTSTPGLRIENVSDQLFINEHLTSSNKILLNKAKEVAKIRNYRYIWVKEGVVYARKEDRAKVQRILAESDLDKLV